jgi:hypothetical protein
MTSGKFKLDIDNDLPFEITQIELSITSGDESMWYVNLEEIAPYGVAGDSTFFNDTPVTISMSEDIAYAINIVIDSEQAGESSDPQWNEDCFPDLDSPPIYLCDSIMDPIDASATFTTPQVYIADNTCAGACSGSCISINYCGDDGYLGVDGLSCSEYPYLGDFADFSSPSLDPPIYAYITLLWDGSSLSQSGFAYPLDSTCDGQNFTNDGDCDLTAFPIPVCSTGLTGMPCTGDTDCNTQTECTLASGTENNCSSSCEAGIYNDGWTYLDIDVATGEHGKLNLSLEITADEIGEVVIEITEDIQDVLNESIPSPDPIALPGFDGFNIKGAKIAEKTDKYPNHLTMDMQSDFLTPIEFVINMDNFFDKNANTLTAPITIDGNVKDTISLADYLIAKDADASEGIDSINISYGFQIEPGEYTISPINNKLNIGSISYEAKMSDLKLEYISAIAKDLGFPSTESEPIEGMPVGFEGFELFDIQMELTLYNQIGINVALDVLLAGSREGKDSIPPVNIIADINYPYLNGDDCEYAIGDTAMTLMRMDRFRQTTTKYCGVDTSNIVSIDTLEYETAGLTSIVELMNYGPEQLTFAASAGINGEGVLAPGTNIWGEFMLIAPLGFIFKKDLTFLPTDNTTELAALDRSTAGQIDSSLVSVLLNVDLLNSSAIGGDMSLLISDSTIIPLYLDSLWSENTYFDSLIQVLNDSLDTPISYTEYMEWPDNSNRALRVDFYDADSVMQFWVGRLFDLQFDSPDSVDILTGFIDPEYPKRNLNSLELDTLRMGWITEDDAHYLVPMITFASTNNTARTFQTSNFIHLKSFLTIKLDSDGILGTGSGDDNE